MTRCTAKLKSANFLSIQGQLAEKYRISVIVQTVVPFLLLVTCFGTTALLPDVVSMYVCIHDALEYNSSVSATPSLDSYTNNFIRCQQLAVHMRYVLDVMS